MHTYTTTYIHSFIHIIYIHHSYMHTNTIHAHAFMHLGMHANTTHTPMTHTLQTNNEQCIAQNKKETSYVYIARWHHNYVLHSNRNLNTTYLQTVTK